MVRALDAELEQLKEDLLAMGRLAEEMIQTSTRALMECNAEIRQDVMRQEEEMDQRCIELDDRCFTLLALRQPVASDLRFITAGIKINGELERIGDHAVNIANRPLAHHQESPGRNFPDVPKMAELAHDMLKRSLDAFEMGNPELARAVIESDKRVDDLWHRLFKELTKGMNREPGSVPQALKLLLICRDLERVAARATNIAEDVIYIVKGEDVREGREVRKRIRAQEAVERSA